MRTNEGITPYERFYGMKPEVGHVRTFGCAVRVTLPKEWLGKLDDREDKYDGGNRV